MIELILISFLVLIPGFNTEMERATNETGLNFLLVEHEDLSVSLYAWNNATTTIGEDNLPDKMTYLAGFTNRQSLDYANGIKDILDKVVCCWNLTGI